MAHNPLYVNNLIDSCAFDPKYEPETSAANEIFRLAEKEIFQLNIAYSTRKEIDHPNTPAWVKQKAADRIYTNQVSLTPDEQSLKHTIHRILAGNGKWENMEQDATHVFEAQKYGGYFITTDKRILDHSNDLRKLCGVCIVKPSQFLAIVRDLT